MNKNELELIKDRYANRKKIPRSVYSKMNLSMNSMISERRTKMIKMLSFQGISDLADLKIIEVGCGSGGNILELIYLGAEPSNIVANELLEEPILTAKKRLPNSIKFIQGDASKMNLVNKSFDIAYQSVVFSSILDDRLQASIADKMFNLIKPGGGILWYDFIYDNPRNPDVRGVNLPRIRELFPLGQIFYKRVTLAPPIARYITNLHPSLYSVFNSIPFLRTHVLCYIKRPQE